jgi:hypothetical protein
MEEPTALPGPQKGGPDPGKKTQVCFFAQILVHMEEQILPNSFCQESGRHVRTCRPDSDKIRPYLGTENEFGPRLDQTWTEYGLRLNPDPSGPISAVTHYLLGDVQF